MNKKIIITVVVIVVILLGAYLVLRSGESQQAQAPQEDQSTETVETKERQEMGRTSDSEKENRQGEEHIVRYTDDGYFPSTLIIKKEDKVIFKNESIQMMWTASAVHPTHAAYSGTTLSEHCPDTEKKAFDQCGASDEYHFTFEKIGSWKYHNHLNPGHTGTIIVE